MYSHVLFKIFCYYCLNFRHKDVLDILVLHFPTCLSNAA